MSETHTHRHQSLRAATGPTPQALRQLSAKTLGIQWSDLHGSVYNVRKLRLECRCALCVDEWTREKKIDPAQIPENVHPVRFEPVGRYAYRIDWSDGHSTGFYTFELLRSLCECPSCRKPAPSA